MKFTHLHVHTQYSLLDGSCKLPELVARTKELGMDSLAITDHGVMYGVINFYKECKKQGVHPVIGCEIYVAPGSRFDRESGATDGRYNHLVLLAENNIGYENLMKIVSIGFTEGYYYKPRVDFEVLEKYHDGIIALSACLAGSIPTRLRLGLHEEARLEALRMESLFGKGNFFLELQDHGMEEQKGVNQGLMRLHEETGIPLVATNDVHYVLDSDAEPHDLLLCIQTGKKVTDEDRMRYEGGQFYLKSGEEMERLFPYAKEAISNTYEIAHRCQVDFEFGNYHLPHFEVPEGYTSVTYLKKLCEDGLVKRYGEKADMLRNRLEYELNTIESMGFVDYFLIVSDFIHYAKNHDIPVGPGRGSAAGSIVSYCLEITDLEPIQYDLLFERFLNPERVSMPDIDIDFCPLKRQAVIDYVTEKYGKNRVAQIITFGTMKAKNAIRDVGRVLDLPYAFVDAIAKAVPARIPDVKDVTIQKAMEVNSDLRAMYDEDDKVKKLIDMAMRLEGLPRHASVHAAGVVIAPEPVDNFVPLSRGSEDVITTQFEKETIEELGLLKMDFLGLRNLTVIQDTVNDCNRKKPFSLKDIKYDDASVYDMIASGKTEGVFQLESPGMTSFMKDLKPECFEDIIAGISLYRPGPMDFIPQYIEGKKNQGSIVYLCKELEPILSPTYGCIVYQEQVMQIVRDLAGFSYGRSDLVRRTMAKKKFEAMEKERKNFVHGNEEEGIDGCVKRGISEEVANQIFDQMIDFANYAFNKSHAAAYAVVAYQTAYLKYYFPKEYMAALLTSVMGSAEKVSEYIMAARKMGIEIMTPDVNEGEGRFHASENGIRYGMAAIKGLGMKVIDEIVKERKYGGAYTSLKDFCHRLSGNGVNKRAIEGLIKSGAMDSIPGNRRQKLMVYTSIIDGMAQEKKTMISGQFSLLDLVGEEEKEELDVPLPKVDEYEKKTLLSMEKEVLGAYVSGHPLDDYASLIEENRTNISSDFLAVEEGEEAKLSDKAFALLGGIIVSVQEKSTRKGDLMASFTLEDLYGTVEVVCFPRDYAANRSMIKEDRKVFVRGHVQVQEERDSQLICSRVIPFDKMPKELWVQFENRAKYEAMEKELLATLHPYEGDDVVKIFLKTERQIKALPRSYNVQVSDELLQDLYHGFGTDNIRVVEKGLNA